MNPHDVALDDLSCTLTAYDERGTAVTGFLDSFFYGDLVLGPGEQRIEVFEMGKPDGLVDRIRAVCRGTPSS